jgi:hypothetical protein
MKLPTYFLTSAATAASPSPDPSPGPEVDVVFTGPPRRLLVVDGTRYAELGGRVRCKHEEEEACTAFVRNIQYSLITMMSVTTIYPGITCRARH